MDLEEFSERITESIEGLSGYIQALEEFVIDELNLIENLRFPYRILD